MFTDLSVKKLLSIVLSIAWVDLIASQRCINCRCCPENFKTFLLLGVLPVAVIWIAYGIYYYFIWQQGRPDETVVEQVYHDQAQ